jgi:aerobic C4-dicarboxylate transport protein
MALIFGVDKFMSECRALTNIIGNGVATIVISAWERELDRARLASVLHARTDVSAVELMQTAGGE